MWSADSGKNIGANKTGQQNIVLIPVKTNFPPTHFNAHA
jgi:hypothetical protein